MKVLLFLILVDLSFGGILKTRLGELSGWESKSRDGRVYEAYTSIPYAQPPVGKLRLKAPLPAVPWKGVLDATKDGPKCVQRLLFQPGVTGQEDCLYLNVYAPKGASNFPVMVYIHGGAFVMGYPGIRELAKYFMDEDIVLVTLTYRLGPLGFISLEDEVIPGNYALKDQALAIKWVSENIDSFGGDPNMITVFGESAGGASSHFHMYSPLSRNLIKGIISESGAVNKVWSVAARKGMIAERTHEVAAKIGCEIGNSSSILDCFQKSDIEPIMDSTDIFIYWTFDESVPMKPVVEGPSPEAFLTEDPDEFVTTIPWITGFTTGEGLLKSLPIQFLEPESVIDDFINNMTDIITRELSLDLSDPSSKVIAEKVSAQYFPRRDRQSILDGITAVSGDSLFKYAALKRLNKHKGPSYLYSFEYKGDALKAKDNLPIPSHAEDMQYLLKHDINFTTPRDETVSRTLVKLWSNFAKFQRPAPPGTSVLWPQYDKNSKLYLRISKDGFKIGENGWAKMYKFWNELPL